MKTSHKQTADDRRPSLLARFKARLKRRRLLESIARLDSDQFPDGHWQKANNLSQTELEQVGRINNILQVFSAIEPSGLNSQKVYNSVLKRLDLNSPVTVMESPVQILRQVLWTRWSVIPAAVLVMLLAVLINNNNEAGYIQQLSRQTGHFLKVKSDQITSEKNQEILRIHNAMVFMDPGSKVKVLANRNLGQADMVALQLDSGALTYSGDKLPKNQRLFIFSGDYMVEITGTRFYMKKKGDQVDLKVTHGQVAARQMNNGESSSSLLSAIESKVAAGQTAAEYPVYVAAGTKVEMRPGTAFAGSSVTKLSAAEEKAWHKKYSYLLNLVPPAHLYENKFHRNDAAGYDLETVKPLTADSESAVEQEGTDGTAAEIKDQPTSKTPKAKTGLLARLAKNGISHGELVTVRTVSGSKVSGILIGADKDKLTLKTAFGPYKVSAGAVQNITKKQD